MTKHCPIAVWKRKGFVWLTLPSLSPSSFREVKEGAQAGTEAKIQKQKKKMTYLLDCSQD